MMFSFFSTNVKREIRLIMKALEYYEEHGAQTEQRPIVHKLYEKVREAYFSSSVDALARSRDEGVMSVHDLTLWQRVKFLFGVF